MFYCDAIYHDVEDNVITRAHDFDDDEVALVQRLLEFRHCINGTVKAQLTVTCEV